MRRNVVTGAAAFLLALSALWSLGLGVIPLTFGETWQYFLLSFSGSSDSIGQDAVQYIRLPHLVLSFLIGAGLAVTGAVMQAVMKNPLADPYLLGLSSGASLGAVLAIAMGAGMVWGLDSVGVFAFFGAGAVSLLILLVASVTGKGDHLTLLLSGFAMNAACSAAVSFIVTAMANPSQTRSVQFWMMGQIMADRWSVIAILAAVTIVGICFFFSQSRILDLMLMGDDLSLSMGRNLSVYRKIYIMVTAVMVGSAVYCAGMIGFIGLLIPHAARIVSGSAHRRLLPLSALLGGCFLVWADIIGRNAVPGMEIPIGITAALAGAPFFVWILFRRGGRA